MIRIAIGGLSKEKMEQAILKINNEDIKVVVSNDFEGGQMLLKKEADYYFGACNSGGGAAIALLIGLVGYTNCVTIVKNGERVNRDKIKETVNMGKIVYGMAVEAIEETVPMLIEAIINKIKVEK
ncbi:DUF2620 domain-containing protein [Clostridium gasigenes]|uniref:DUF2620 family protein n=1 Tax=Clostridium gasigenes TaxID=94869 RepID=UPI001C0C4661|nr:DUF2620 family protein [Clostridium gasigenes]MBU3133075.1 DUF2620 domain-containing protein [Clostridium gasigenes]